MPGEQRRTLTRVGVAVLVGGTAMIVAGFVLGVVELEMSGGALVALVALARLVVRRPDGWVDVRRTVRSGRVDVGELVTIDLEVTPRRGLALPCIVDDSVDQRTVRIPIERLARDRTTARSYHVATTHRGLLRLGNVGIDVTDPFGLARVRTVVPAPAEVLVLPRQVRLDSDRPDGAADPIGAGSRRTLATHSDEFDSLRDYVPGDDVRHVHWPSTARLGRPLVRRHEQLTHRRTTVVLGPLSAAPGADDAVERAVSAAASVLTAARSSGDVVRLVTASGLDTGAVDDPHRLDAAIDRLAALGASSGDLVGAIRAASLSDRIVICATSIEPAVLAAATTTATAGGTTLIVVRTAGGLAWEPQTAGTPMGRSATTTGATTRTGAGGAAASLVPFLTPDDFRRAWSDAVNTANRRRGVRR